MFGNLWKSSRYAAESLGIKESTLSTLRETGLLKPGIHWKSDPYGQNRPWNPAPIYNVKHCEKFIKSNLVDISDKYAA